MKPEQKQQAKLEHVGTMFLDSGAHSLFVREVRKVASLIAPVGVDQDKLMANAAKFTGTTLTAQKKLTPSLWKNAHDTGVVYQWFESDEFYSYVDGYIDYVVENRDCLDHFTSVDVIFNPKLTWKVQQYIERALVKRGIDLDEYRPLPVVHYGTDMKWLKRYEDDGHEYIGIGGMGQEVSRIMYKDWADKVFTFLDRGDGCPRVRTHGFAVTAYGIMSRYPWYSVDSASWLKAGAFGKIFVPRLRNGKFDLSKHPYTFDVSAKAKSVGKFGKNIDSLTPRERTAVMAWIDEVGVPLGDTDAEGNETEWGVVSNHHARKVCNMHFFELLVSWLPEYPWPFVGTRRRGFLDL